MVLLLALIAQGIERLVAVQKVGGSIPSKRTKREQVPRYLFPFDVPFKSASDSTGMVVPVQYHVPSTKLPSIEDGCTDRPDPDLRSKSSVNALLIS